MMLRSPAIRACVLVSAALLARETLAQADAFELEEASIAEIHDAIRSGATTCADVVQGYIERARAYNGVCTALVTADGAPVPAAAGPSARARRSSSPPTRSRSPTSCRVSPSYKGDAPEFGRMEPTASDPTVMQQYGMVSGIPNAGQVNALETLNIRGERSVTCKGAFDAHPSTGPLPAGAPAECEEFRKQPDAVERATELDRLLRPQPRSRSDAALLRRDVVQGRLRHGRHALDGRRRRQLRHRLRADRLDARRAAARRRRDHLRQSAQRRVQRRQRRSGRRRESRAPARSRRGGARETWGGATCNPYDTSRQTGGSSGGSGASVAANLVVCSICESTGGSCRSPGTHNGVVTFVPTKGMISYGGGIGADPYRDRPGISCRTVEDTATVLDAFRDPRTGSFFDARDIYTALPRSFASEALVRQRAQRPEGREAARRHAHRRDSRAHGQGEPERRRDRRHDQQRAQGASSRSARSWSSRRGRATRTIPRFRTCRSRSSTRSRKSCRSTCRRCCRGRRTVSPSSPCRATT